jgi:hypothetical protein
LSQTEHQHLAGKRCASGATGVSGQSTLNALRVQCQQDNGVPSAMSKAAFIFTFRFAVRGVRIAILRLMFIKARKSLKATFPRSLERLKISRLKRSLIRFISAAERLRFFLPHNSKKS